MKSFATKIVLGLLAATVVVFGVKAVSVNASQGFSISSITVDCNATGQVFYTGTIPQGGFTLELMDKAPGNSGPFISTVPPTVVTITSGASPVSYSLSLTNWNPPHLRVDSSVNTKSASLNCGAVPTSTPTPTPTVTNTPTPTFTPTPTPTNTPNDPCDGELRDGICIHLDCNGGGTCEVIIGSTPTVTPTVPADPTATPTNTPSNGDNNNNNNNNSNNGGSSDTHVQAVLGATTMAATGTFETKVMNLMLLSGTILLAFGSLSYAKEKRA